MATTSAAAPATPTGTIPLTHGQRWRAFWVCVSVAAITILDMSKVNVALPAMEQALGAGSTELQLIVSGYVLTFGLVLVPAGRLGDQRSKRALFIVGLSLFTITSLLCGIADSPELLIAGRLLQGVAAGIQMPQVIGMTQQLFQGEERGRAFGLFGATIGIATAFGPTLGGLLIAIGGEDDGWRWVFWMNVPLGVLAIAAAIWVLPRTRARQAAKLQLDPVGVVLFGLMVLAFMWPFLFTTGAPTDDPRRWWLMVAFALFAAAFYAWERAYARRGRAPLVPFRLFRIPSYRNGTMVQTAYFTAVPAMFLLTNLFLQSGAGLAPVYAGMVTIGFALASAVSSWIGGNLVTRHGRPVVVWGLAAILVSVGALAASALFLPVSAVPWVMAAVLSVGGFGGGLVIAPNQTLTLQDIPVREGGIAGSVGQLGQRIGAAVGTAIGLSLFYSAIYAERGGSEYVAFHDAYALGMAAVGLFLGIAFLVGVVDLTGRRRRR